MTHINELLKAAYAEGSRQALIDGGYDAKTAANMSEEITEEMTPTVPNQFNPVIGLEEKPPKKLEKKAKAEQAFIKEWLASIAKKGGPRAGKDSKVVRDLLALEKKNAPKMPKLPKKPKK